MIVDALNWASVGRRFLVPAPPPQPRWSPGRDHISLAWRGEMSAQGCAVSGGLWGSRQGKGASPQARRWGERRHGAWLPGWRQPFGGMAERLSFAL